RPLSRLLPAHQDRHRRGLDGRHLGPGGARALTADPSPGRLREVRCPLLRLGRNEHRGHTGALGHVPPPTAPPAGRSDGGLGGAGEDPQRSGKRVVSEALEVAGCIAGAAAVSLALLTGDARIRAGALVAAMAIATALVAGQGWHK